MMATRSGVILGLTGVGEVSRILLLPFDLLLNPLQIGDQAVVIFYRLELRTVDELA
jgi:hypothetical protein